MIGNQRTWACQKSGPCDHYVIVGNDTTDAVLMMLTAPLTALTLQRSAGVTARGLKQLSMYCGHTLVSLDLSYCTGISQQSLLTELKTWFPMITTLKLRYKNSGIQWNLQIKDNLVHGTLSTIRRLSFIGGVVKAFFCIV